MAQTILYADRPQALTSETLRRPLTGLFHLEELVAVPGPADRALDQRAKLVSRKLKADRRDAPLAKGSVMLLELFLGGMTPPENRQDIVARVQQEPGTDAGTAVGADKVHGPLPLIDVHEDARHDGSLDAGEDLSSHLNAYWRARLIRCSLHGESCCYVQNDRSHASWKSCCCKSAAPFLCPIDSHSIPWVLAHPMFEERTTK